MKKRIRFVAGLLAGIMVLGAGLTAQASGANPFLDVKESDWYYPYALRAIEENIVAGKGTDDRGLIRFDPNKGITRAEFVQIMYNVADKPAVEFGSSFSDIRGTEWYAAAVNWAVTNGVASGKGSRFDPNGMITREEIAVMLHGYARMLTDGETLEGDALQKFADADQVHSWAKDSVEWALEYGVMAGKGNKVAPISAATRAEAVTMMEGFVDNCFRLAFNRTCFISPGETLQFPEGILFTLTEFYPEQDSIEFWVRYTLEKDGVLYEGEFGRTAEDYIWYSDPINCMNPVTFVDANENGVYIQIGETRISPEPMVISGQESDVYTTEDYEYIQGEKVTLYLDKNITIKGDVIQKITTLLEALEEETGLKFDGTEKRCMGNDSSIRHGLYGMNPWPGVEEGSTKLGIYVSNDAEMSCAHNTCVVLRPEDFDYETNNFYVMAHELSHTIQLRNCNQLNTKLMEGYAVYIGRIVALRCGQDYPISNWSWESNYDLIYNMTDNNAEELFLDDSLDDGWYQYKFGFVFTTYLMEEYGKDTYHTFMSRASAKMEDVITSVDTVTLDETLKEVYGENIFEDFTAWYQVNMERFRLPE